MEKMEKLENQKSKNALFPIQNTIRDSKHSMCQPDDSKHFFTACIATVKKS